MLTDIAFFCLVFFSSLFDELGFRSHLEKLLSYLQLCFLLFAVNCGVGPT